MKLVELRTKRERSELVSVSVMIWKLIERKKFGLKVLPPIGFLMVMLTVVEDTLILSLGGTAMIKTVIITAFTK